MKKLFLLCLLILVVCKCSSHTTPGSAEKKPRLKLDAHPHQGFAPLRVTFYATLEEVSESDPNFYCLEEKWDFGDGAVSFEKSNCEPFGAGSKIKTEFLVDHVFDEWGSYDAFFVLGENRVRARVGIIVLKPASQP